MHGNATLLWRTGFLGLLSALILFTFTAPVIRTDASPLSAPRCFPETGFCIDGRIREYWELNGGLPVFGLPISAQQAESIEGQTREVQWFERNRLELHPENAPPYDVQLGRLGVDVLAQQGRDWQMFPRDTVARPGCRSFAETQQNVCGDILAAWQANGLDLGDAGISAAESLALFGLPISPLQAEEIDGQTYQVQWFERARFELHPENAPPFTVLLGLLGKEAQMGLPPTAPTQPGSATRFSHMGIWLGIRAAQDWNQRDPGPPFDPLYPDTSNPNYFPFLCRVRGDEVACPNAQGAPPLPGVWPAGIVVFSEMVFDLQRYAPDERVPDEGVPCSIRGVSVSAGRQYVFRYLQDAAQQGIPIIIRLDAPGNFQDAVEAGRPHRLLLGARETPLVGDSPTERRTYCAGQGRGGAAGFRSFRALDDLLDEMEQIRQFLRTSHPTFIQDHIYFIPANEPNGEWYEPGWWTYPQRLEDAAFQMQLHEINQAGTLPWDDMNRFFSALYQRKQERGLDNIHILTPPMGAINNPKRSRRCVCASNSRRWQARCQWSAEAMNACCAMTRPRPPWRECCSLHPTTATPGTTTGTPDAKPGPHPTRRALHIPGVEGCPLAPSHTPTTWCNASRWHSRQHCAMTWRSLSKPISPRQGRRAGGSLSPPRMPSATQVSRQRALSSALLKPRSQPMEQTWCCCGCLLWTSMSQPTTSIAAQS